MIPDPNSRLFARLTKPKLRLGLGSGLPAGGPGVTPYDYYIDATTGNDSNDGRSAARAWASLSKIGGIPLPAGSTKRVLIAAATYDTLDDWVERSNMTPGGQVGAGSTLQITFEAGSIMDGTVANTSSAVNAFEFSSTDEATAVVFGNGLTVRHYNYDVGGASPNGFGNRGKHLLYIHDTHVADCVDCYSAHGNAKMFLYDCTGSDAAKSAFAHVENARFEAYRSTFTGRTGSVLGIGAVASSTAIALFEDCKFIPVTSNQTLGIDGATLARCQVGTLTMAVMLTSGYVVGGTIEDSFVNAYVDGHQKASLLRCYGLFSTRVRNGGDVRVSHSVISSPASSQTAVIFSNFNPGSAAKLVFNDNIVQTANAGFMNIDATNAGYLVSSASEFYNNVLSGSAAFDIDLISADSGNTVRAGSFQADALIGAANTLDPDDYGYEPGSPAIGAAMDGGHCGFAIGEVPRVAEAT